MIAVLAADTLAVDPGMAALGAVRCFRARQPHGDQTALDMLAIGDPRAEAETPEPPAQGVFVTRVTDGGEGARVGLQPGDVLRRYDGQELIDDTTLRDLRQKLEAGIEDHKRPAAPVAVQVWREGQLLEVQVKPGPLGVQVGRGGAHDAWAAARAPGVELQLITRTGDLERIGRLPPLRGARDEATAVGKLFEPQQRARTLLGQQARGAVIFDLAAKAKYLHFACHGIAEEYAGQSLSMLVLALPKSLLGDDSGFLKFDDLLQQWRGRLASTRCVVLSACRTNVGPLHRDEAPQALPIGFLFAGAASVISSLWAVDDASTKELMTSYYRRLLDGEQDRLRAFTAAKQALRAQYPDPFHWAPFLYLGSPD